jgi:5-methylcytosine-specific restriction enzyme A
VRRPCFTPGCPALVAKGDKHCPTHTTEAARKDIEQRGTAARRGYDGEWREVQAAHLKAHPWCARCQRRGRKRKAVLVHHIIALRDGGARLDPKNHESACRHCHGIETEEEVKARGGSGTNTRARLQTARESSSNAPTSPAVLPQEFFFV